MGYMGYMGYMSYMSYREVLHGTVEVSNGGADCSIQDALFRYIFYRLKLRLKLLSNFKR
jgi:hypothetical protein